MSNSTNHNSRTRNKKAAKFQRWLHNQLTQQIMQSPENEQIDSAHVSARQKESGSSASNILCTPQGLSHISRKSRPTPDQQNQSYFVDIQKILQSMMENPQVSGFEMQSKTTDGYIGKKRASVSQRDVPSAEKIPVSRKRRSSARNQIRQPTNTKNQGCMAPVPSFDHRIFEVENIENISPDFAMNK